MSKYRIIKDGNGDFRVQERKWLFIFPYFLTHWQKKQSKEEAQSLITYLVLVDKENIKQFERQLRSSQVKEVYK